MDRLLSQEEIDSVFRSLKEKDQHDDSASRAQGYDFRRPDRIPKDQLRAIHVLHENFARSLASSLSAYLRAYAAVNLVSVEQLSFAEFSQCLPSPTCLMSLGMKPYDGNVVLELNPGLVFPVLEMLLGGTGKHAAKINREITEIEQIVLDSLIRIILHDLKQAWQGVTMVDFLIEGRETEPQLLQILSPNEAVVAIGLEVRIGENAGMINIGMPSILIKMLRQKLDQQWSMRRSEPKPDDQARLLRLLKPAAIHLDARLEGPTLAVAQMMQLEPGDVLTFDYPVERPITLLIDGKRKFRGELGTTGRKKAFVVGEADAG